MEDFIMYEKYLEQLEEAGKIRNLKERSINCYKNYVSYFLKYQNKNPEETHKKLTLCRNLLGCKKYLSKLRDKEMPEILKQLYGINIYVCKSCGGHLGKPQLRIPQRC